MMTLRIKHLPIVAKSLIAPIAAALIIVAMAICVTLATTAAIRLVQEAAAVERLATALTAARLELTQGHVALFRAVNWKTHDAQRERIDGARREAMAAVERAGTMTRSLDLPENWRAKAEALRAALGKYQENVKQTVDVVLEDSYVATMLMGETDEIAVPLTTAFRELAADISAERDRLSARATKAMRDNLTLIVAIAAAGIFLALALAWLPVRLISRPVKVLTAALSRLAQGDLSTPVADDDRADEIGSMIRAVIVLKQNSQEMRRLQAEQRELEARATAEQHELESRAAAEIGRAHV